jgi:hypothetical protein
VEDGATEVLPLVEVVDTFFSEYHEPHVVLFEDSQYSIVYPAMEWPCPEDAPDHESVTLPAASVEPTEQEVGADGSVAVMPCTVVSFHGE